MGKKTATQIGRRGVAAVLAGAVLAAGTGGCTGNAGADAGLVGVGSGLAAFGIAKASGMKTGGAAAIGAGVGAAAGAVTFFTAKSKYEREAQERDREAARRKAEEVAARDRAASRARTDDYYVPTGARGDKVEVQKIDARTNEPEGPIYTIDQRDVAQARNEGKPVRIDGHDLVDVVAR